MCAGCGLRLLRILRRNKMKRFLLAGEGIDWNQVWNSIIGWLKTDGLKILIALVVLWLCFKITNFVFWRISARFEKRKADKTLSRVIVSVGRKVVKLFLILMFISYVGIDTSSIVAAIAASAVAVGLALQGALSNLAAGVLIICLRPFRIGDYIECAGANGTVEDIGLFQTRLVTPDNKVVIVPNSSAISSNVTNYSIKKIRRVELIFSIAYENDFRKAKYLIEKEVEKTKLTVPEKPIFVNIKEHNTSSIDIVMRAWVKSPDYWDFYWMMLESVKLAFDKNGITIPYSQMDVHIKDDAKLPSPVEEDDEMVKAQIEKYHESREQIYENREKRLKQEKEDEEFQERKKDPVKYLAKKKKEEIEKKKAAQKKKKEQAAETKK